MNQKKKTQKTAYYGLLIALAFIFSYIESMFPIYLGAPGVKLGLANLVTIVALYTIGVRGTVMVSMVRIILTGLTFGNMFSMIYSLAGWALSISIMLLAKNLWKFSTVGVSVLGGIFHNIGQLLVAAFVVETAGVFSYFPVLLFAGTIAGTLIGILGGLVIIRVRKIVKNL